MAILLARRSEPYLGRISGGSALRETRDCFRRHLKLGPLAYHQIRGAQARPAGGRETGERGVQDSLK